MGTSGDDEARAFVPAYDRGFAQEGYDRGFAQEGPAVVQGMEAGVADARVADVDEYLGRGGGGDGDFLEGHVWDRIGG